MGKHKPKTPWTPTPGKPARVRLPEGGAEDVMVLDWNPWATPAVALVRRIGDDPNDPNLAYQVPLSDVVSAEKSRDRLRRLEKDMAVARVEKDRLGSIIGKQERDLSSAQGALALAHNEMDRRDVQAIQGGMVPLRVLRRLLVKPIETRDANSFTDTPVARLHLVLDQDDVVAGTLIEELTK